MIIEQNIPRRQQEKESGLELRKVEDFKRRKDSTQCNAVPGALKYVSGGKKKFVWQIEAGNI